jgi:(1->4)-alpha-D-glucan 1-alpha-D-glucosylmutase
MRDCIDQTLQRGARIPLSTYRLQMHAGFPFSAATKIINYLNNLGSGDIYSSPILEARPGSLHGYDVTRYDRINPELGGEEGFALFRNELMKAGMGLLLDIVPNHMGVGNDSLWWQDVLENGRSSRYAEYFDINWESHKPDMRNKLLLPILGAQYGEELENKRIQLSLEDGRIWVRYFDHRIPLAPQTMALIFDEEDEKNLPTGFMERVRDLQRMPPHHTTDSALIAQRQAKLSEIKPQIEEALHSPALKPILEQILAKINGVVDDPKSFDRLHKLLEAQPYRLAFWRVSTEEINYRRFFDINDLVGLRMEHPKVFAQTHCLIRRLLAKGQVNGLRIDHCDGLFNPRHYLIRLQLLYLASQCYGQKPSAPTAPSGIELELRDELRSYDWTQNQGPLYVVVEKILEPREYLPREWPVRGTSGYDFVYLGTQIFIQHQNEQYFDKLYTRLLGYKPDPDEIIYRCKLQVMRSSLASEVYVLRNQLSRLAAADRHARDFTDNILETVIRETIACFPVYRTYIDDRGQYTDRDRAFIRYTIARAKKLNPGTDASAFDFLRDILLLTAHHDPVSNGQNTDPRQLYFVLKFQQLTGPVMAKGVEDTAMYTYNRFLPANEVGGSIKVFGIPLDLLHQSNQERLESSPGTMLGTSTHDTKRSEDVRSRLNVLSEMPTDWTVAVRVWQRLNARFKQKLEDGRIAPDANEEYLLYQTILGAWPWQMETLDDRQDFLKRLQQYAAKALNEAKVNTSWLNPDTDYLQAVFGFLERILLPTQKGKETRFAISLLKFLPQVQFFGAINSLALTVLKIASPGVPDFYRGSELWDLSLVDPDNRRPVDYNLRSTLLTGLRSMATEKGMGAVADEVLQTFADGRAKMWVTHRGLIARREHPQLFQSGSYIPLTATQGKDEHVIGFFRQHQESGKKLITALPRFARTLMRGKQDLPLGNQWEDAELPLPGDSTQRYTNVFTGESLEIRRSVRLSDLFARFPVAMLLSES